MTHIRATHTSTYWAARSDETNCLDGRKIRLHLHWWKSPKHEHGTTLMLFPTRRACRAWIDYEYGYIKARPDLRAEPHGWRVPRPVRVTVEVTECLDHRIELTPSRTPAAGTGSMKPAGRQRHTPRSAKRCAGS